MPDRHEFKVVIDGAPLDAGHKAHINAAIQKAAAAALIDAGTGAGGASGAAGLRAVAEPATIWASFGRTNGIVFRPLDGKLTAMLKAEGFEE
jgi:hypothetical protein